MFRITLSLVFVSLSAFAQTTIVENSDAVARHPYSWSNGGQGYDVSGSKIIPFGNVPQGRRLVIEYISGILYVPDPLIMTCLLSGNIEGGSTHHRLTLVPSERTVDRGNALPKYRYYTVSQPISLVVDDTKAPTLSCWAMNQLHIDEINMQFSITGRLLQVSR